MQYWVKNVDQKFDKMPLNTQEQSLAHKMAVKIVKTHDDELEDYFRTDESGASANYLDNWTGMVFSDDNSPMGIYQQNC